MKKTLLLTLALGMAATAFAQDRDKVDTAYKEITNKIHIDEDQLRTLVSTLAADDMKGRGLGKEKGVEKAAAFIEREYQKIGLEPLVLPGISGYRQAFTTLRIKADSSKVKLGDSLLAKKDVLIVSNQSHLHWSNTENPLPEVEHISSKDDLIQKLKTIKSSKKDVIILIDEVFRPFINSYRSQWEKSRSLADTSALSENSQVYILTYLQSLPKFDIEQKNTINEEPLHNLIGQIPGKSKKDEYIIFSAHYDNVGIIKPNRGDSIANGADENASGVAAVLALAKWFKEKDDNERTLLFVNYSGETVESAGAKYFAKTFDSEKIKAVINIDAIGKESQFGKRSAFITGYNKSDLGEYINKEGKNIKFKFKPDPYKDKKLFYGAANTALAMKGVPAHTFSTIRIDGDRYLFSVRDDINTVETENMVETIKAIAYASEDLVKGTYTPSRITDFKDDPKTEKNMKKTKHKKARNESTDK